MSTIRAAVSSVLVRAGRFRAPIALLLFGAATVSVSASCGRALTGTSPVYLVIDNVVVQQNGVNTNVLRSDVVNVNRETGQSTVFEDSAVVNMRLALKDPGIPTIPTFPTSANQIQIDRVHINYRRADGRNTPGVDVPFPIDGASAFTVLQAGASGSFTLVRANAKLEPPLLALRGGGGQLIISTIAEISFYGHDMRGRAEQASINMDVHFADWADEQ